MNNEAPSEVTVIGAGFSGLVTAFYLTKRGIPVRIIEKEMRAGGLIRTVKYPEGLAETAANSILNSKKIEELFEDLELNLCRPKKEARARYIFRKKPRRWPLGPFETFALLVRVVFRLVTKTLKPKYEESVRQWGERVLGKTATDYLLEPALQGVYAGDIEKMSANLLFGNHSARVKTEKGRVRGIVAPEGGMETLIVRLCDYLQARGVRFELGKEFEKIDSDSLTVVATSVEQAAVLLETRAPQISGLLKKVHQPGVITVTCFYDKEDSRVRGFGCLFPRREGYRVLGVLFNTYIFEGRVEGTHSETWIFGGGTDPGFMVFGDVDIERLIKKERAAAFGQKGDPLRTVIKRWPKGIPHYDLTLEKVLEDGLDLPKNLFLSGNYLGGLGLAKVLEKAFETAKNVETRMKNPSYG